MIFNNNNNYVPRLHAVDSKAGPSLLMQYGFKPADPSVVGEVKCAADLAALDPANVRILVFSRAYPNNGTPRATGADVVAFCRRCPKLQQLEYCGFDLNGFSAQNLLEVARACPLIEAIRMLESGVTWQDVQQLDRLLPRLRHIDPRDTPFARHLEGTWQLPSKFFRFSIDQ